MSERDVPVSIRRPHRAARAQRAPIAPVTFFADKSAQQCTECRLSLTALELVIRDQPPAWSKAALPLLKLATFGTKRSDKNCLRSDTNVLEVHGVEGDKDAGHMPMTAAVNLLKRAGVAALLYTSPSATSTLHKWRVLCLLRNPIKGTEHEMRDRRQHWAGVLNAVLNGVLAPESFALSQTFYFGGVQGRSTPRIVCVPGVCIDELRKPPQPLIPGGCRKSRQVTKLRKLNATEIATLDKRFAELVRGLELLGLYRGHSGAGPWHAIRCPWSYRHTDKENDGARIVEPGADNNHCGGFKCFHGHCADAHISHLRNFLTRALTAYYSRKRAA